MEAQEIKKKNTLFGNFILISYIIDKWIMCV